MPLKSNDFETHSRRGSLGAAEPLPAGDDRSTDPRMQRVDALLDSMAKREPIPARLSWRLFAASVEHLPRRAGRRGLWQRAMRSHVATPVWGQVALAASVALTFAAATWFVISPTPAPSHDSFAHHQPAPEVFTTPRVEVRPIHSERFEYSFAWLDPDVEYLEASYNMDLEDVISSATLVRDDLGM